MKNEKTDNEKMRSGDGLAEATRHEAHKTDLLEALEEVHAEMATSGVSVDVDAWIQSLG